MAKTTSTYQQGSLALACREALRLLIPYQWRRRVVALAHSRFGRGLIADWLRARVFSKFARPMQTVSRYGDFYESLRLLPYLPKTEVQAILQAAPTERRWPDELQAELAQTSARASIIVVTYNNLALTKLCLESLFRNTEDPSYELIVVDNQSVDGTPGYLREMAARHANMQLILNETNHGFAKANNQGLARATGDYLVLLNNDTVVPPGWLSRLLWHLRDPQVGLVGPFTNFAGNEAKIPVPYRSWAEMEIFARQRARALERQIAEIPMLAMFCVALRREIFEKIGQLDEQFGIGLFEDDDYSLRARRAGYRVICAADVYVHHFGRAAFGTLMRRKAYDNLFDVNRAKYEAKWGFDWTPHVNVPLKLEQHLYTSNDE